MKDDDPRLGDWLQGHTALGPAPRGSEVLRNYANDPFDDVFRVIGAPSPRWLLMDEQERYRQAFHLYRMSLRRLLPALDIAARWAALCYWDVKRCRKLGARQRQIADRFNIVKPYLEHDFFVSLQHARIVMDRVTAFSRLFLPRGVSPSFTSFADHKRFFRRWEGTSPVAAGYRDGLLSKTNWFEVPLKYVRDQLVVHQGPRMGASFGYDTREEFTLLISLPRDPSSEKPLASVVGIVVDARQLAMDLLSFLEWYAAFTCERLEEGAHDPEQQGRLRKASRPAPTHRPPPPTTSDDDVG